MKADVSAVRFVIELPAINTWPAFVTAPFVRSAREAHVQPPHTLTISRWKSLAAHSRRMNTVPTKVGGGFEQNFVRRVDQPCAGQPNSFLACGRSRAGLWMIPTGCASRVTIGRDPHRIGWSIRRAQISRRLISSRINWATRWEIDNFTPPTPS
jgi:hypothetical protein